MCSSRWLPLSCHLWLQELPSRGCVAPWCSSAASGNVPANGEHSSRLFVPPLAQTGISGAVEQNLPAGNISSSDRRITASSGGFSESDP